MKPSHWLARASRILAVSLAALMAFAQPAAAQGGLIRDSEIEQVLRDYSTPLWNAAGLTPDEISLYIVNDPSLNAFVAGGANIFVHTGLILAAQNPNQLKGVLAHETGHISGGHLVRSREAMRRSMGPALISIGLGVLAMIGGAGDAGAALISGAPAFAQGNFVRHTQVQESAADQAAMSYLEQSGQSGEGLIDFFNRNLRQYEFNMRRAPPYMVSHPFTSDRVESLRARVEQSAHRGASDSPADVFALQMIQAKLYGFLMTPAQTLSRYPLRDTSKPARYARAVAWYRAVDIPAATREIESLIAEEPNNPYFYELYGQILFENGRAEEAIPHSRRALQLRPDDSLLLVALARALIASEQRPGPRTDEAVRLLERATALDDDNAFAWRELAAAHSARGEEGLAELASAEQAYVVGDYPRAVNFAERARRALPQGQPAHQRAADIAALSQGELRDARERRS